MKVAGVTKAETEVLMRVTPTQLAAVIEARAAGQHVEEAGAFQ